MTNHKEKYLRDVAYSLVDATEKEKQAKQLREQAREEFFRMADEMWRSKEDLVPVQTVEVPQDFFVSTGLTQEQFMETRYPGWDIEHVELNPATMKRTFILKRNIRYLPRLVEVKEWPEDTNSPIFKVSKDVAEYTPEIDWETLKAERPDLFKKLSVRKTTYELNEKALEELFEGDPEEASVLQRHLKVRPPSLRVTARRIEQEGENE